MNFRPKFDSDPVMTLSRPPIWLISTLQRREGQNSSTGIPVIAASPQFLIAVVAGKDGKKSNWV